MVKYLVTLKIYFVWPKLGQFILFRLIGHAAVQPVGQKNSVSNEFSYLGCTAACLTSPGAREFTVRELWIGRKAGRRHILRVAFVRDKRPCNLLTFNPSLDKQVNAFKITVRSLTV